MRRMNVGIRWNFAAHVANNILVGIVSVFDVLRNVRHQNHFVAVRAFGAGVVPCEMIVQHFLCIETLHAIEVVAFDGLHIVQLLYVMVQTTERQKIHTTILAPKMVIGLYIVSWQLGSRYLHITEILGILWLQF